MHIDRNLQMTNPFDETKDKARNYVWCNISNAVKQGFVAHQFRLFEGAAYNTTQSFEYQVDRPVSEKL